jgi:signal transduction histidine kinase
MIWFRSTFFNSNKKLLSLLFFCVFLNKNTLAQNKNLDSLKHTLSSKKHLSTDSSTVKLLLEIANLASDINLDTTALYLQKASTVLQKLKWPRGLVLYHRVAGHYYFRAGLYDKALEEMQYALKMATNLNDQLLIASLNLKIGAVLNYSYRFTDALNYLEKSSKIFFNLGNKTQYAVTQSNIGATYIKMAKYRLAINILNNAMKIIESSKDENNMKDSRIVAGNNLLAVAYLNEGLFDSSEICKKRCIALGEKTLNHHNLFDLYHEHALFYKKNKKYEKSISYAKKSLQKASFLNSIEKKSSSLKIIYENFSTLKMKDSALYYLEKHKFLEDSIQRQNVLKQIAALKNTQEEEKQQLKIQELEISSLEKSKSILYIIILFSTLSVVFFIVTGMRLNKQNTLLKTKNQEITEAMLKGQSIERKRVAADLHDNLGSTLSALWMSLESIDKSKMDEKEIEVHELLKENLENAYNDVRLLSHNMLPEEFEKQGLEYVIRNFIKKMNKISKVKFELDIKNELGRLNHKIEFELYSVCLELVNNILKHAYATEVKIELYRSAEKIFMLISDNGRGIKDFSNEGKGTQNIKARLETVGGIWKRENLEGRGLKNEIVVEIKT